MLDLRVYVLQLWALFCHRYDLRLRVNVLQMRKTNKRNKTSASPSSEGAVSKKHGKGAS